MFKRKLKYFRIFIIVSILTIAFFNINPLVFGDGEGWLDGWDFRQSHTINQADNSGINYQIKIIIDFGSGSSSGNTIYVDGKCQTDFDDIIPTDNDGITELDYWMESKTDSDNAVFWVEVSGDLDAGAVLIYVYYGNDAVSTTSDGDATFLFFDDFLGDSLDTDKWEDDTEYASVTGGILTYEHSVGSDKWIMMNEANYAYFESPYGYAVGGRIDIEASGWGHWGFRERSHGTDLTIFYFEGVEKIFTRNTATDNDAGDWVAGQYERLEITLDSTYATYYVNFVEESNSPHSGGTIIPDADLGVIFNSKNYYIKADWVYVRKFVDPEPVHGAWGEEESEGVPDDFPFYSDVGSEGVTQVGLNNRFSCFWEDDLALDTCYFSTNNTGSWFNHTLSVSGVSSWANKSLQLNYTTGVRVEWKWFCMDNASQWNTTSLYFLVTTSLYITWNYNNSTMGNFYVDDVLMANETALAYNFNQSINLVGGAFNNFAFLNFTWLYGNSIINNYNYYTSENNTVWCYFGIAEIGGIHEDYFVLGFVIAGCAILFMVIVLKNEKKGDK